MQDVLEILLPWALSLSALFALVLWDESHLPEDALARAWPPSTRAVAIFYFGVFALPVHFWRTRRSWLGLGQGILWGALVTALEEGVGWCIERAFRLWASS
jgi:hypothetical protein